MLGIWVLQFIVFFMIISILKNFEIYNIWSFLAGIFIVRFTDGIEKVFIRNNNVQDKQ